ncbi:hypothetical protein K2173_027302 [Erythroxylum novogranatense]|uniref:Dynein light chain n=1 Tax=Erythroxylum novogranatense TaxID=1862640 RepID=A0AAV8U257_9ROSI|nr:hypothetical protein K2173_027302 [Erythroxylum novogranatense]
MERRPESEHGKRLRRLSSSREAMRRPPTLMLSVPPIVKAPSDDARLAAIAVGLNVRLRSADMPGPMQERAFRCTRALLDASLHKRPNPSQIAMSLKKEFDSVYGPAWHCIVGKSFGSFVTHSSGGFVYFSVDKLCFLIFKTEVRPLIKLSLPFTKLNVNN